MKKSIIITGGSSGIGRATSLLFQRQGFSVINLDMHAPEKIDLTSEKHIKVNLLNDEDVARALDLISQEKVMFPVALVNSAGIREICPAIELDLVTFQKVNKLNVEVPFVISQFVIRNWLANNVKGSVVNIGSVSGSLAEPARAAYVTSKHAIIGLTKQLAFELGKEGIRVNCVSPGVIRTPLTEKYFEDENMVELIKNGHALGKWGEANDVAELIYFLSSEKANFITGANYMVDGGWSAGKNL